MHEALHIILDVILPRTKSVLLQDRLIQQAADHKHSMASPLFAGVEACRTDTLLLAF